MSEARNTSIAGGDFPPDARTLVFRGISGVECESFIRSVRFIALMEGKEDDDRWMLHFATARLSGRALRWHVRLDKQIRNDWDLLAAALLDEYPVGYDEAAVSPSIPSDHVEAVAQSLTPSSQPPAGDNPILGPGLHLGRIRIVSANGLGGSLYLARDLTLASNKMDAIQVQFLQSDEPHGIGILELDWYYYKNGYSRKAHLPARRLAVYSSNTTPPTFHVCADHSQYGGTFQLNIWRVTSDFTVGVTGNNASSGGTIRTQVVAVGLFGQDCIFVADFKLWAEKAPDRIKAYYEARFVFEPIFDSSK